MTFREMLDMQPLPFKWLDEERATFLMDEVEYGIHAEYLDLKISNNVYDVANISFGRIKDKKFTKAEDIDTSITNFGKPRTVLTTVSDACLANKEIINCDLICIAAADQAKEKRLNIYSITISEIRNKVKSFEKIKDIYVKTKTGTGIIILSKIEFSKEEQQEISEIGDQQAMSR